MARVIIILSRIREFWRCMGGGVGAIVRVWWLVQLPMEAEFLGFGLERSWSTSVVLFSSG